MILMVIYKDEKEEKLLKITPNYEENLKSILSNEN